MSTRAKHTRPQRRSQAGLTLIELMIVVAVLGILTAVAVVSYSHFVRKAKYAEANSMLANIRLQQEAYRATFHQYAFQNITVVTWYPDNTPREEARFWTSGAAAEHTKWNQLGVRPSDPLYFSYYTESGAPGDNPVHTQLPNLTQITANDFWFVAQAVEDLDEDGLCGGVETYPGNLGIARLRDAQGVEEKAEYCP